MADTKVAKDRETTKEAMRSSGGKEGAKATKAAAKKTPMQRKPREKKAAAEGKAASTTAKTTRTRTTKREMKTELFLEYGELQMSQEDVIKKVKHSYKAQRKKIGEMKSVRIYLKPEEGMIYYVVNGTDHGSCSLY